MHDMNTQYLHVWIQIWNKMSKSFNLHKDKKDISYTVTVHGKLGPNRDHGLILFIAKGSLRNLLDKKYTNW